jgi:thiamine-monophosphate kinase
MDEFALIRRLTDRSHVNSGSSGVVVGIGDDAAVVAPTPRRQLVITCDAMVETVHHLPWTMDDRSIGWKALASNISDLAAMGAEPRWALISLSVPTHWTAERLERVYDGLYACAAQYGVSLIGGDTTSAPAHLVLSVTAIGEVEADRALLRSGARAGDVVFITGPLGLSAAGLDLLVRQHESGTAEVAIEAAIAEPLVQAHRYPLPQVAAGRAMAAGRGLVHALNDISDGLASETWEIAEASHVRIQLHKTAIPIAASLAKFAAAVGRESLDYILYGGEDYQLVGTVAAARAEELLATLHRVGASPAIIGTVQDGPSGVEWIDENGAVEAIEKRGYNHFATS